MNNKATLKSWLEVTQGFSTPHLETSKDIATKWREHMSGMQL